MQKAKKPPLTRAITDFVTSVPAICEEVEQVVLDGGSISHLILLEKNRCQEIGLKYASYVISNFKSASVFYV